MSSSAKKNTSPSHLTKNFCYSAPSKTFLVGEYAVLQSGSALILNTHPCFTLNIQQSTYLDDSAPPSLVGIHPDSPAGQLITMQAHYFNGQQISFHTPHMKQGGFGASSAQFAMLWRHLHPHKVLSIPSLRSYYQSCHSNQTTLPSGADVIAQLVGHISYYQPEQREGDIPQCTQHTWPFPNLCYSLLKTATKVNTHQHLAQLLTYDFSILSMLASQSIQHFLNKDAMSFAVSINRYQQQLRKQQLLHPKTQQLIQEIQDHCDITAIKGCGALGADVLLVLLTNQQRDAFQQCIQDMPELTEIRYGQRSEAGTQQVFSSEPYTLQDKMYKTDPPAKIWQATKPANLALIKYMGKEKNGTNIPCNPSLSYQLNNLTSTVQISLNSRAAEDIWLPLDESCKLNKKEQQRFLSHLQRIKRLFSYSGQFVVRSANGFPANCGLASSASSFAALTACAVSALTDLTGNQQFCDNLSIAQLSRLASGSSCRSFFGPWALWEDENVSSIDLPYPDLHHAVLLVTQLAKKVPSSQAHIRCQSSPLFAGRAQRATQRLEQLIEQLRTQSWENAFLIIWEDFLDMHRLFETANPSFHYLTEHSHFLLNSLKQLWHSRHTGPLVSVDAGANIHLLWRHDQIDCMQVIRRLIKQCPFPVQLIS